MSEDKKTVTVYVPLLNEGTPTVRATQAIAIGDDFYRILSRSELESGSEEWEFPPESIVKCDIATDFRDGKKFLRAYAMVGPDGNLIMSSGGT